MLTTTGHRLPGAPGRLVTETAVWGALIVLAAISYVVAGTSGYLTTVSGRAFTMIGETLVAGEFDNLAGSLSLLIVFVLAGAGLFIPSTVFARRGPGVRKLALSIAIIAEAVLLIVLSLAPSAWLTWVCALILGAVIGLLMSLTPFTNEKPWRRVGVPATVLLFLACSFQIMGGSSAGTQALGWMSLAVGIAMAIGAVMIYLTPERALHAESATTGAFPVAKAKIARPPATIDKPWVPTALFAVLGAAFILAQPTAIEHGFGQAGYALILVVALLGWAIGFEMGPTFAPGMSRPRVSAFALTVSGILLVATGAIDELSGKVVLTGAVAFLVGIGVRSQVYDFSRRIGAVAGGLIALLINAVNVTVDPIGADPMWSLPPADVAFVLIGLAALIAGIVGLFVFDPHGMQGLSVDIVHGFRPHAHTDDASRDGVGALADRFGPGFFIAIEGGDGSGKSTQIARISRALADEGYSVEATREPGGTELGRQIRSVLFDSEPPSPRTEALLFAADRAHHVASLVDPGLDAGSIVITDRYIDSTVAYQAAGREFDPTTILALSRWATEGLIPHLTIVLDIDPEVAAERMSARGGSNYLDEESQQFHQRVRQTYLSRAQKDPERYVVLDASVTADELTGQILEAVHARLPHTLTKGSGNAADAEAVAESSPPPVTAVAEESETIVLGTPGAPEAPSTGAPDAPGPAATDAPSPGGEHRSDERESAGDDEADERSRFIPVSDERVVPTARADADEDGVATDRVDLGADLRDDRSDEADADSAAGRNDEDDLDDEIVVIERETPVSGARAASATDAEATDREAADREAAERGDRDEPTRSADQPGDPGEAATTVLPAQRFTPRAPLTDEDDPDEAPTNVIDTSAARGHDRSADDGPAADEAETTVLPARSARQTSRERLQAQAEIERQARERVRRQRERNRSRGNGPGGSR
ncbi:dTMP kinase [Brevibacterium casei]|uniref:dTMP kinase n=1 Tax=Brevibacterium casei TaxID=33889 RepID=UPI00092596C3|nr:dTMP kinase [Brevibacterium casei]SIJ07894.1 Thymidylate kinase [Mycobacteroides abscessus subsp. abscessus]MCT1447803.1 dTMP kinase [Brevibacterium casei]MCT2183183.1 dTMP kinase [Brevibacterium casei]MCT2359930.1 dTMP kinase [Brevibacterium casei]MDH5150149.1 dTMP kinase [Brevibacterium casei]